MIQKLLFAKKEIPFHFKISGEMPLANISATQRTCLWWRSSKSMCCVRHVSLLIIYFCSVSAVINMALGIEALTLFI